VGIITVYDNFYCHIRQFKRILPHTALKRPGGVLMVDKKNIFFRQVTKLVCSSLDIEIALVRCLSYMGKNLPADEIFICLYEQGLSSIKIVARATTDSGKLLNILVPVSGAARSILEKSELKKVKIINRTKLDAIASTIKPIQERSEYSALAMPLKIEEKMLGVLFVSANGKDRYAKKDADLLALVADPFAIAMLNALRHQEVTRLRDMLADDNRYLRRELRHLSGDKIIGEDFGLKEVLEMVRQVATLNNPVMLLGETGTGKELIANAIHYSSHRKDAPLIKVNCGAIPETLIDSEFFGHDKGAFTGAISQKRGKFERAHKGTIFLDEIGELPLNAQVRLLRVIQSKEIERVGGTKGVPVDTRIITATHRNLKSMVDKGLFREDLWFRLNVFPITIPPLRQRKNDIPALVQHFIEKKSKETGTLNQPILEPGAMDRLIGYHWPGNVRELENVVERALILSRDNILTFDHFETPRTDEGFSDPDKNLDSLDHVMARHINLALRKSNGKIHGPNGAAAMLKINSSTLRNRMKKFRIRFGRNHLI
jgi:transcriptional regulator with GAF, ATPase, and Fis domain